MKYLKKWGKLYESSEDGDDVVSKGHKWSNNIKESVYKRIEDNIAQVEEITQTIKDILLPVSDLGYNISVTDNTTNSGPFYKSPNEFIVRVVSYGDKSLQLTDVKEDFIRMVDYLESLGFNQIDALYVTDGRYNSQVRTKFSEFIKMDDVSFRNLLFSVMIKESGVLESFSDFRQSELEVMVDDCKDILSELEDEGLTTRLQFFYNPWINITISSDKESDKYVIEDVVERLKNYLSKYGFDLSEEPTFTEGRIWNPETFTPVGRNWKYELKFVAK